ncbi:hypothetical protein TNCV_743741 [Trichonephila clavipes]|nr:hypothetical protein TNCV_743741 [Trichonephila clavipes]
MPHLFFLRHPDNFKHNVFLEGSSGKQYLMCWAPLTHVGKKRYEWRKCRPVVTKIYPQNQCGRAIYCPPYGKLDTASKLGSHVQVSKHQWRDESRGQIFYTRQAQMIGGVRNAQPQVV